MYASQPRLGGGGGWGRHSPPPLLGKRNPHITPPNSRRVASFARLSPPTFFANPVDKVREVCMQS